MKPEIDIYKSIRINRAVTISMVVFSSIVVISCLIFSYRTYVYQMNHSLILDTNGDVLPFKYIDYLDARKAEAYHHVEMFHKYFYEYDKNTYEERLEKAFNLSDVSTENLYLKLQNEGWFNQVKQMNLTQKIIIKPGNIVIEGNNFPFHFKASCILRIKQLGMVNSYNFETSGYISDVKRHKYKNPHGLLISNYVELNKTKIEENE